MRDVGNPQPTPSNGRRHHAIQPAALATVDTYDGETDALSWLANLNELAVLFDWDEEDRLYIAKIRLQANAKRWSKTKQFDDWTDFEQQLIKRFSGTPEMALAQLERCFQQPEESAKDFADRFLDLARRAGRQEDTALLHQFIRRLQYQLRLEVTRQRPASIDEAANFCHYWTNSSLHLEHDDCYNSPARLFWRSNMSAAYP